MTAVIFDWDNTLVDTWHLIHKSLNSTFDDLGMEQWTLEQTRQKVGHSLRNSFAELFDSNWEKAGELYLKYYQQFNLEEITPLANAEKTLKTLHSAGIPMAVVSNKTGYILREEAKHIGWDKYFVSILGSKDTENDKPHPEAVLKSFIEHKHIKTGWFIGDTMVDVQCALNSGYTPVHIGDGYGIPDDVKKVKEHNELLKFLSECFNLETTEA